MRPAGKLKFWRADYPNRPGVNPPMFLRLVMVFCALSLVGTLLYGVFSLLGHLGGAPYTGERLLIEASLLFLLPIAILYAISTNHPSSRYLIIAYFAVASFGFWRFGRSIVDTTAYGITSGLGFAFILISIIWLFLAPRARVYYALIANRNIPEGLERLVGSLTSPSRTEILLRRLGAKIEPFSPILIIAIAIALVVIGLRNMTP